ncbi:unnamed protein product [Dracunculus medinensis]|uniref:Uncharacterized protein n=1 Tax=Dracunculus medinensis TaxID=318479 RepID=A0A3P7SJR7_DRAME|nr:unnamed protein product [Dracunculus medinensis]
MYNAQPLIQIYAPISIQKRVQPYSRWWSKIHFQTNLIRKNRFFAYLIYFKQ